ncbi:MULTISPECIES: hypothetical protein [unclassified Isoptericola]|uniref:hypothetical protein n=1 Tax=unclassified Isoptericola TaxID=2623355 RepID=UPI00365EC833
MRSTGARAAGGVLALTALLAGCELLDDDALDDEAVGFGTPQVEYLDEPELHQYFRADPAPLDGELRAPENGCLVAVIDGTEHVVFWPDGTRAVDSGEPVGRYVVTLPGGTVLEADASGGDAFTATGVVADAGGVIAADPEHPDGDYVGSYLSFCGVDAPPVKFPDAATFVVR